MLIQSYVIDLDGVLIDSSHRIPLLYEGREKYFEKVNEDSPIHPMREVVRCLAYEYHIILLTGRIELYRQETCRWLAENSIIYHQLFMRPNGCGQVMADYKQNVLASLMRSGYDIVGYFEDNPMTVEKVREMGVPTVLIDSGYYEFIDPREKFEW